MFLYLTYAIVKHRQ